MERKRLEEEIGFLEQRLDQSVLEGRRGSRDVEAVEDRVLEMEVLRILSGFIFLIVISTNILKFYECNLFKF